MRTWCARPGSIPLRSSSDPSEDVSIAFDDPELAIPWPLPVTVRSQRDRQAPPLAAATGLPEGAGTHRSNASTRALHL
jgi:hypothetical protein